MKTILSLLMPLFFSISAYAENPCYNVKLEQHIIFCVRAGIGSISAESRSQLIEQKIEKLAKDYTLDPESIVASGSESDVLVTAGDINVISLTPRDADLNSELDLKSLGVQMASQIKESIKNYRAARTPDTILLGLLYTLIATLGYSIALFGISKAAKLILNQLTALSDRYFTRLTIKSYQIISPARINQVVTFSISVAKVILVLILSYFYIPLVLSFFPWTDQWAPKIINYILDPIKHIFWVVTNYAPNLFFIAVILAFTHYVLKFVRLIFNEIEVGNLKFSGFHKEWAQPTFKLLKFVAYAISFVMIFPYLPGSSSPAFQGLSVFLGVLVSFGSGSAIANMVSGIVMTYMRPFRLGDRVRIAETVGDVIEKNFLVTRIKTIKNVEVTIPNAMVLGSHIINYSSSALDDGLILNTTVTIGYDVPWVRVHELLKQAASRTEHIDREKESYVLQTSLDDFYVSYELNAFTKQANKMAKIYSDLHQNIQDAFNAGGVEIMSPHYSSLRDGNEVTIPANQRPAGYKAPSFKISTDQQNK